MSLTSTQWISIGVAILLLLVLSQGQFQNVNSRERTMPQEPRASIAPPPVEPHLVTVTPPVVQYGSVNPQTGELVFPYVSGLVLEGGTNASQAIRLCGTATTAPSSLGSSANQIQFYTGTNLSAVMDTDGLYVSEASSKLQLGPSLRLSHSSANSTSYLDCDQLVVRQNGTSMLSLDPSGNFMTSSVTSAVLNVGNETVTGNSTVAGLATAGSVRVLRNVDISGNLNIRGGTNAVMATVTSAGVAMADGSNIFIGSPGAINSYVSLGHGLGGATLNYDSLSFQNISGMNPVTSMYLGASGNVGIGTAAPQAPLDVNGNANVAGIVSATNLAVSTTATIGNVSSLTTGYTLNVGGAINCSQVYVNGALLNASTSTVSAGTSNTFTALQTVATASTPNLMLLNTNTVTPTPASITFNDTNVGTGYRSFVAGGSVTQWGLAWTAQTPLLTLGQAQSIALSSTGQYQLAAGYGSSTYAYTIGGTNLSSVWVSGTVSDRVTYGSVTSSGQYQYLLPYAGAGGWYSSTYGATFSPITTGFTRGMGQCAATSSTGAYTLMGSLRGELLWSSNGGTSTVPTFTSIACGASVPSVYGEWFQIKLATATAIGAYQIAPRNLTTSAMTATAIQSQANNRFPNAWYVMASNDAMTWSVLDYQTGQHGDTATLKPNTYPGANTYTLLPTSAYTYYRFVWCQLNSATMDIGGVVLWNTAATPAPLFPRAASYTVAGYALQLSGTTVATVSTSNNPTGASFVNTYVTDDASTNVPLVLTGDGYTTASYYGFLVANATEYSANNVAIAGNSVSATAYGQYTSCAMSSTGQYSVVAYTYPFYSVLYASSTTNGSLANVLFAPLTTANGVPNLTGAYQWTSVAMSSDGKFILALCSSGKPTSGYNVYLCSNGTAGVSGASPMTFTLLNGSNGMPPDSGTMGNVCVSSTGQYMSLTKDRSIGYSTNYGMTWTFVAIGAASVTDIGISGDGSVVAYTNGTNVYAAKPSANTYGGYYADVLSSASSANATPLGSALTILANSDQTRAHSVNVNSNLCLPSDGVSALYFTDVAGQTQASSRTFGRLIGSNGYLHMDYYNTLKFRSTDVSGTVLATPIHMRSTGTSYSMDIRTGSLVTFYDEVNSPQPFGVYNANGVLNIAPLTASGDSSGVSGLMMDMSGNAVFGGSLSAGSLSLNGNSLSISDVVNMSGKVYVNTSSGNAILTQWSSGTLITPGINNAVLGSNCMQTFTSTTNSGNVAVGYNSMQNSSLSTTNSGNVAVGYNSMQNSSGGTISTNNVAIGSGALAVMSGNYTANTAIGPSAMGNSSNSPYQNVAIGYAACYSIGYSASAYYNIGIGSNSLSGVSGTGNIGVGFNSGNNVTTGNYNISIGYISSRANFPPVANRLSTGSSNIYIGYNCLASSSTVTNEIVIGSASGVNSSSVLTGNGSNTCTIVATGGIYASSYNTVSDRMLKQNIAPIQDIKYFIHKFNPVQYSLVSDQTNKIEYGLIAQEVKEFLPQHVNEFKDGLLSLDYSKFVGLLIAGLQDAYSDIDKVSNELNATKDELQATKDELSVLQEQMARVMRHVGL